MQRKVRVLWEREQDSAVANVLKQEEKIAKDPSDVKVADVERAVYDYVNFIEEARKDEDLQVAFDVCDSFLLV